MSFGRTVFLANEQASGRGRFGRGWVAPAGCCLLFSVLVAEAVSPIDATAAASVAVAETIEAEANLAARIKWPNDVMIGARKVCGVLTEVVASGDRLATVIGIGLNVNLDLAADGLPPTATSLSAELGKSLPRNVLFNAVVARLQKLLMLPSSQLAVVVHARWEALLWRKAQGVRLADGRDIVEGIVEGLAPSGGLLLRVSDGTLKEISTGELLFA